MFTKDLLFCFHNDVHRFIRRYSVRLFTILTYVFRLGTNVAFRKPANQSTTVRGGAAANGNDGEKTTEHDGKRCTETQREASPWWQVDLLRHYAVKVVRVTTRGCCGKSRHQIVLINQWFYTT